MDTSALKRFAVQARTIIRKGVYKKLLELGFDDNGVAAEQPRQVQGATLYRGQQFEVSFYHQWRALARDIQNQGFRAILEGVAYTWFNRFMAIQILHKNGFIDKVLTFDNPDIRVPHIVSEARAGRFPALDDTERMRLLGLISDPTKAYEQFSLLIIAFCHHSPILQKCFGATDDYTELLLPLDILDAGGFLDLLNQSDFISDEDYKTTELLGWLYQFYISERKDEVMKKNKYDADEIPAVTQIFTPNWIVKYMVQNTLGRIYLDNNPDSSLADKMKYLVKPCEPTPDDAIYRYDELEQLKVIDPACGSGHILLEAFDMLYDIYLQAYYSRAEAIEAIFRHNLTGIDLDTRAKQLATFALLLKACQKDRSFLDAHCLPRIYDMPEADLYTWRDTAGHLRCAIHFDEPLTASMNEQIEQAFTLLQDAQSLGSIMKFEIDDHTRQYIEQLVAAYDSKPVFEKNFVTIIASLRLILTLTDRYAAVVANPPYMACSTNDVLAKYVKDNYAEGKADICTVFMMMQADRLAENGYYANIIPPSWMFLSSFEGLRKSIVNNNVICSLLHLSRGVFGADFGSVSCVIQNRKDKDAKGTYFRLIERTFQEFDQKHLQLLFEKTLADHNFRYYFADYTKEVEDIVYSEHGAKIYYPDVSQQNFSKIPGSPIGYWLSEACLNAFDGTLVDNYGNPKQGTATGDNNRFLRLWFEIPFNKTKLDCGSYIEAISCGKKWFPTTKGGSFRRWYGNKEYMIAFDKENYDALLSMGNHLPSRELYFKTGPSWSTIASGKISFRHTENSVFEAKGSICFPRSNVDYNYLIAYLNTHVCQKFLGVISPTLDYHEGPLRKVPFRYIPESVRLDLSKENITLSKSDWDAHETSWDFEQNELIALNSEDAYIDVMNEWANFNGVMVDLAAPQIGKLEWLMETYKTKWETKFRQLHANEEELNRQFIDIYGLQDELTPDVPLNEITILQQGEITIE